MGTIYFIQKGWTIFFIIIDFPNKHRAFYRLDFFENVTSKVCVRNLIILIWETKNKKVISRMSSQTAQKIRAESSSFLHPDKVTIIKNLGGGTYGIVSEILLKYKMTLKQIDLKKNSELRDEMENELKNVYQEFSIMRKHLRNVVRSHHFFYDEEEKTFSFTMDYIEGKNLRKHIESQSYPLPYEKFYPLFENIITGKKYYKLTKIAW